MKLFVAACLLFPPLMGCSSSHGSAALDAGAATTGLGTTGSNGTTGSIPDATGSVLGTPDTGSPTGCPIPTNGPTTHNGTAIAAGTTETWTAAASPHLVTFDTNIEGTLNLEPCAEVLVDPSYSLIVRDGQLMGIGTSSQPIHIGASDKTKPFRQIRQMLGTGQIKLAYTTIDGGGDPGNSAPTNAAMIEAQGVDGEMPTQEVLFFDHVTLRGSASQGIFVHDGAGFSQASQDLTVTGSADFPIAIWERAVGTLPTGSYVGNAKDAILLDSAGTVKEDETIYDRGVPYDVGTTDASLSGELRIQADPPMVATLTIEPGVILRFAKKGLLAVNYSQSNDPARGAIVAMGTADSPIVFTSLENNPAPGDWEGIRFTSVADPRDKIDHARVEYAGGVSNFGTSSCDDAMGTNNEGAIRFTTSGPPSSEVVSNTVITSSASNGIDRGWLGAPIDFLPTNTFQSITRCDQTDPNPSSLPGNPSCPSPAAACLSAK